MLPIRWVKFTLALVGAGDLALLSGAAARPFTAAGTRLAMTILLTATLIAVFLLIDRSACASRTQKNHL